MSATEASEQANRAQMEPVRLVIIFLLISAVVVGLFLANVLTDLFGTLKLGGDTELMSGIPLSKPPQLLGFVLAIGAAVYCWVNPKVRTLSTEVASELMRVSWPSFDETRLHTVAVVVASLVAAVLLFGIDRLAYEVMVYWLPALWEKL